MASVGSTDGGYQSYRRSVDDLEEDYQTQVKRTRDKESEASDRLEQAYRSDLSSKDEDFNKTAQNLKNNLNDTLTRERDNSKNDIERMKAQTYDRFGKYHGEEASALRDQLIQTKNALEDTNQRAKMRDQESSANTERMISENNRANNAQMDRVYQESHDSLGAMSDDRSRSLKAEAQNFQEEKNRQYAGLNAREIADTNDQHKVAAHAIEETKRDFDHQMTKGPDNSQAILLAREKAHLDDMTNLSQKDSAAHAAEVGELRSQIQDFALHDRQEQHARAVAGAAAVKGFEQEWTDKLQKVDDKARDESTHLKESQAIALTGAARTRNRASAEQNMATAEQFRRQNQDSHDREKDLLVTFDKDRTMMDKRMVMDRQASEGIINRQADQLTEQSNHALTQQQKTNQELIARTRTQDGAELAAVQSEMKKQSTSEDTNYISPGAEAKMRQSIAKKYESVADAEQNRNKVGSDSMLRNYRANMMESENMHANKEATIVRDKTFENQQERASLSTAIADLEYSKGVALRDKDQNNMREAEVATRSSTEALEGQRRQYEELLQTQSLGARSKIAAQRQDTEFSSKMNQRASISKQNELVRDYERKLSDQKTDFDLTLKDMKGKTDVMLREADRKNKFALEEQARNYEQRIVQSEVQTKERERMTERNYEDELDKIRRSNALLISKKS